MLWVTVLASSLVTTSFVATPSYAVPSYPTWSEVQAAKKSVTKKKALIARFNTILAAQLKEEEKLSRVALQLGEKYNVAKEQLQSISAKVATLQAQADVANEQANDAKARLAPAFLCF